MCGSLGRQADGTEQGTPCRNSVATWLGAIFLHKYSSRASRFFYVYSQKDKSVLWVAFPLTAFSQLSCNSCHVEFTQLFETIQLLSSPSLVFRLSPLQIDYPGKLARIHSPSEETKLKFYRSYVNSTRGRDWESIFENKVLSVHVQKIRKKYIGLKQSASPQSPDLIYWGSGSHYHSIYPDYWLMHHFQIFHAENIGQINICQIHEHCSILKNITQRFNVKKATLNLELKHSYSKVSVHKIAQMESNYY